MTISFSGLASGLDTTSWVEALMSVRQQKIYTLQDDLKALQTKKSTVSDTRSVFTAFRSAIEKITDTKFGGTFDLFGKNSATSSNTDIFTATADSNALRQSYDIVVHKLATSTKAVSKDSASAIADDETVLSNLGVKKGSFSVYLNGEKKSINITDSDKVADLKTKLSDAGIDAEIDSNGSLILKANIDGDILDIGSTTDSTNISSLFGLEKQADGSYKSSISLYKATTASVLTSENSGFKEQITAGTFSIGDAEFTIDKNTTLSSLISKINNTADAQAYAYWDDTTGKLSITSTREGASYINIEAGTSNFTDIMGLTTTERDLEGNVISTKLNVDAQELGENALLSINGTNVVSTSNTVSSDISRIKGVTLKLNKTSEDENGDFQNTSLKIEQDSKDLKNAVKSFIKTYNDTISKIDEVTATGADLRGETTLTSFKNTIRSYVNGSNTYNGGEYRLLSQIGISTGKANKNDLSTDTNTLEFDEDTFMKALEEDPDSVKAILGGENGILTALENSVEQTLQAVTGFFDVKTSTIDSDIKRMTEKITKQQESANNYKKQLENKFHQMELTISQLQQNYSSFLSTPTS